MCNLLAFQRALIGFLKRIHSSADAANFDV